MLEASDRYKREVYTQTRARRFKGSVMFELLDVGAYEKALIDPSPEAPISRTNQLIDKVRTPSHRYASYEYNYFKLDGSFVVPPYDYDPVEAEVGWWSEVLSDAAGKFVEPTGVAIYTDDGFSSAGITINFNPLTGEHAVDFTINILDAEGAVITKKKVVGNKDTTYVFEHNLDKYYRVEVDITKWSAPFRRAKIISVDFGIMQLFANEDLISMYTTEEINVAGSALPCNELRFTVDNQDKAYNILNPEGQYRFLMERQEVWATLSLEVSPGVFEDVSMGKFYLKEWLSNEGALTTTFTALDIIDILGNVPYVSGDQDNLYDLTVDVLTKAGVTDYVIDEGLSDIPTEGFVEVIDSRKALYFIGMASKSIVRQNRYGVLEVKRFRTLDAGTSFIHYIGQGIYTTPNLYVSVNQGYDMKNITLKNTYSEPQIKLDTHVSTVLMEVINRTDGTKTTYTLKNPSVLHGTTITHNNPLITTGEHALDIAKWILKERSLRALYDVSWRQNPVLECGDLVLIEDSYGAKKQSRIIKQQFDYAASLSGRTETRGGV